MRKMELTTLSTEVQEIQKFTKNRQQKNGGFSGDISTWALVGWVRIPFPALLKSDLRIYPSYAFIKAEERSIRSLCPFRQNA
jgi:hypothetical protein